jgi:cobalt-zinc-cadmium efflux system outer membrane protein
LPARLDLAGAMRLLQEGSLDVAAADVAVTGSAAQLRAAGAFPNPLLGFSVGKSWECPAGQGCTSPAWWGSIGDQGALSFLATGQRGLAVDAAEKGLAASVAARDDVRRNQAFLVKQHFVNASVAARALRLTGEEVALSGQAVALARERLRAGAIHESDLARLEVLQMQMEQAQERAEWASRQARIALARVLGARGAPADFEVEAPELSSALMPPRLSGATQASLTAEALARRPDVVAGRAQVEQARLAASLARRQVIPTVSLQASYEQQGSPGRYFTPPTAILGLSVPLPVAYQQQGQIGLADAATLLAEIAASRLEAQVTGEVAAAWSDMTSARSVAQRAEQRLLQRSRSARGLVTGQYAKGAATFLEVLDAARTDLANQLDYLQVLSAYWIAVFQLERAAGATFLP